MRFKTLSLCWLLLGLIVFLKPAAATPVSEAPRVLTISAAGVVEASWQAQKASLRKGQRLGMWTLMAVVSAGPKLRLAIFEDFTQQHGHILFVGPLGVRVDLPKSLEPTFAENPSRLYHGHALDEVMNSDRDLLGDEVLAKPGDPEYDEVAACFPPISKMKTYTFVGTHGDFDKVGFQYGGRTSHFDPAAYVPEINRIREEGRVWDGLVGGWLPVVRFVYPEESGNWSELVAYAPMRLENGNRTIQPVWYRVSRIESNELKWARYFDSYHPFPPRLEYPAELFYEQLLAMRDGWNRALAPGMKIEIPDERLANMTRHSLVRDMITRMGSDPRYGVFDKEYAGNEHAGFPDTFNADTTAMLEWGLFDLASQYIDNYFGNYVRDDGSILYRGPETGQYGRMLTVLAEYANYSGDDKLLLKHQRRIDAVAKLLLALRQQALKLPPTDPAYGMIAGWSEADACLDPDPPRYMQPYFSNSAEAARGFHDLGQVWERIGAKTNQPKLTAWGRRLVDESKAIRKDLQTSINRSILRDTQPVCLPAIAGVKEPFHVAVARDPLDPQFRSYRAYMEMLYSGYLTREEVDMILKYRGAHRDSILGIGTAYGYNTHELVGFLTYGTAYGLVQYGFDRTFLLTLYAIMAHQYTRGTWTAPETRNIALGATRPEWLGSMYSNWGGAGPGNTTVNRVAAPYCTPAQMVVPLMTRWMLVFEDPQANTVWLAKDTPRSWLEDGKKISVENAPTKWGRIGFSLDSRLKAGKVMAQVQLPSASAPPTLKVRLRVPGERRMRAVTLNGQPWSRFDAEDETVTLPPTVSGKISVVVLYQ